MYAFSLPRSRVPFLPKPLRRNSLARGITALLLFLIPAVARPAAIVQGQVTVSTTGLPVEGAEVTLNLEPSDANAEHTDETSPFGFYSLKAINPGSYRLRVEHPGFVTHEETVNVTIDGLLNKSVALTPAGGERFDIQVSVRDMTTSQDLATPVVAERYATANAPTPLETRVLNASQGGGVFRGMQPGHYRFIINNGVAALPKWEAYTNVPAAGSKPLITGPHLVNVGLRALFQDLHARVVGLDPIKRSNNVPLSGFYVELHSLFLPPRTGVTDADGKVSFTHLPPFPFTLKTKKFGYRMVEQAVVPDVSGNLPGNNPASPIILNPAITPTHLYVDTTHPYLVSPLFDFLIMRIEGVTNTAAEGMNLIQSFYNFPGLRDDRNFQFLLPGRYRITMNGQPQFGSQGIRPIFKAEDYAELPPGDPAHGGYTDFLLPLNVVPASVRGRLFVAEEAGRKAPNPGGPRYVPRAGVPIEIVEFATNSLLKAGFRTNIVTTDENGEFTANILPARYGIRIPTLTGHHGREVRLRNLTTANSAEQNIVQAWPYPDPWPWASGLHGDPLIFRSGEDYRMDLFVEKQVATIDTFVPLQALGGSGTVTATLRSLPGNEVVQSFPVPFDGVAKFYDVPPGSYTYGFDRPWFTFTYITFAGEEPLPTPVVLNPLPPPGVVPSADPSGASYIEPFAVHPGASINFSYTNGTAVVQINLHRWTPSITNYTDTGLSWATMVQMMPDNPGLVPSGVQPEGGFSFWARIPGPGNDSFYSNYVSSPHGVHTFEVYAGTTGNHGPMGNVTDTPPSTATPPTDWTIRFVNFDDPDQLVTNETSFLVKLGGMDLPHIANGGQFTTNVAGFPTAGSFINPHWEFAGQTTYFLTNNAQLTFARFRRATAVSGSITNDATDVPVPNAKIQVRDRFGRVLREALSDASGGFLFAQKLGADPVFLDVSAPGFKPHRSRYTSNDAMPVSGDPDDSTLMIGIRLEPLFPSPVIQEVSMDRQGLFLPGVRLSGNESVFNALQALGPLTMTWTVVAKSDPVNASLVPFDAADGAASGPQNLVLHDPIHEVWLVDPRGYTNSVYTGSPIPLPPPVGQGYAAIHAWLQNIATNQVTNVFHVRVTNLVATGQTDQVAATNTLPIWKLPPGDFRPVVAAVTRRGAVTIHDAFDGLETPPQMKGVPAPRWVASALDLMGGTAGLAATQERIQEWVPQGELVPLPAFTAEITADGAGRLLYNYDFAVEWTVGQSGTESGLAGLAPGLLGVQFEGDLNFGLNGAGTNFFFDAFAEVNVPDIRLPTFYPKLATNAVALDKIEIEQSQLTVSARKLGARNYAPITQPYEFEFTNAVSGSYVAVVKADLTPVTSKIPYVGPVLLSLNKQGALTISGVLDGGIGVARTNIWRTPFPPSVEEGSSGDLNKHVLRRHFLGGDEVENHLAFCFRFGAGLDVDVFQGRAGARAKLNLAGNDCAIGQSSSPSPAVAMAVNPHADWPAIERISGNVTATLDAFVKAWVVDLGKSWEWELISFEQSFNTDPFFQLVPMSVSTRMLSPATATPVSFNGGGPVLISNFYAGGTFAAAGGQSEALAFTDIEVGTGNMQLKVALRTSANSFGVPVTIASAGGIAAVDIAAMPGGGWMVVWAQLAPGDVGNPFPPSTIFSSTSTDGLNWPAPVQVAALADMAAELQLVTSAGLTGLAYLHTAEGPEASHYSLEVTRWTGSAWTIPVNVLVNAAVLDFAAEGASGTSTQPAVLAVSQSDGTISAFTWDGAVVSAPETVSSNATETLSLATDGAGRFFLALKPSGGGIALFDFDTTNGWSDLGVTSPAALPKDLHVTPLTHAGGLTLLLSWIEGGDVTSIWTAFVDANGALLKTPSNLTLNTVGRFRSLEVLPRANREAKIIAHFEDGRHDVLEFTASFSQAIALLDAPRRLNDGTFEFRFMGNPSQNYRIEASGDLKAWVTITNFAAPTNGIFILDPGAKTLPGRFYRAVSP
jgi:hypothetical protein